MKTQKLITTFLSVACVLVMLSVLHAQPQSAPLSKTRLVKLLLLGDSSQPELVQTVSQKGVDFQATPADERELQNAGASDDLIVAIRANYRGSVMQTGPPASSSTNRAGDPQAQPLVAGPSSANTNNTPPPARKKGFLTKFNDKLNKINSTLAPLGNPTAPVANQPAQPSVTQPAPNTLTAADAQTNQVSPPAPASGQKKGLLDKLNNGLNKANEKITKVASTLGVNPIQSAQPAGPSAPNTPNTPSTNQPNPVTLTTAPTSPPPVAAPLNGNVGEGLAGTYWSLLSMTAKGEKEERSGAPPDVQFCNDGSWGMLHYGGAIQGGKYQMNGGRVVMKNDDGTLFGDFEIKRNGNEMILDDDKYVLRLKYVSQAKC